MGEVSPGPRGIQRIQGISHNRLTRPKMMKNGRQPKRAIKIPPASILTPGPLASPAEITEFTKPRLDAGKYFAMMREYAGNATDSPIPSINRTTMRATKPCNSPVTPVAADHMKKPMAMIQFALNRSTNHPATVWNNGYVQKNAESRTPNSDGESLSSSFSIGAAMERLPRSM